MTEILFLTDNYPPQRGGMAQSADRIVAGLRQNQVIVHVVHFTNRKEAFQKTIQHNGSYSAIRWEEDEAHVLNRCWSYLEDFQSVKHLICFGGYLSMLGAPIFSKWFDWDLTLMIRGNDLDVSLFSSRKKKILEDAIIQSSTVLTVSSLKQRKIERIFNKKNVHFVPNGIRLNDWKITRSDNEKAEAWRKKHIPSGRVCLGVIGQLKTKKGLDFLLGSLLPYPVVENLHFLFIGELSESTQELFASENLSYSHIEFLDRFELIPYYLAVDAITIPSFYDGMPNVLIEAGALGVPIIAASIDGMFDVIEDGLNGLLFQVGNRDACREKIYQFVSMKKEEKRKLGENLKTRIHENHTDEQESKRIMAAMGIDPGAVHTM